MFPLLAIRKMQIKNKIRARLWWLTPVILATQEAEISRITVRSQPGESVPKTYLKNIQRETGLAE
jgi:hypothetical protein